MCRLLKYCFSHCLYATMTKFKEVVKDVNRWTSVRFLGYLSNLCLFVAVCLGLYVMWEKTANSIILVILILGLFALGIASIFYYYFSMETVSLCLIHAWFGFLLGLLSIHYNPSFDVEEQVTDYLLLSSTVLYILWALLERVCGISKPKPMFLTSYEVLELIGFSLASTFWLPDKSAGISFLSSAFGVLVVALRTKSYLALPNAVCFAGLSMHVFFLSGLVDTSPFALSCFFVRLISQPLLDVYFSGLSAVERWQPLLLQAGLWRRLTLLPLIAVEGAFLVLAGLKLAHLEVWNLLLPAAAFTVFGVFWLICHVVLVFTLCAFQSKLSDCQRVLSGSARSDVGSLGRVMTSKGMRHFCLISQRLAFFSVASTVILGAISWQVR